MMFFDLHVNNEHGLLRLILGKGSQLEWIAWKIGIDACEESLLKLAQLIVNDCPVSTVTVYSDRAEVTRTVSIDAIPGTIAVTIRGLPPFVVQNTLQVSGGQDLGSILDVSFGDDGDDNGRSERASELAEQLRAAEQQQKALTVERYAAEALRVWTEGLAESVRLAPRVESSHGTDFLSAEYLDRVRAFSEFYSDQITDIGSRTVELNRRLAEVNERGAGLARELDPVRRGGSLFGARQCAAHKAATVVFGATAAGTVALQLTYCVPGATWRPAYDCRVESAMTRARLTYYGVVVNQSGDSWDDASVLLSTASPSVGGEPPKLRSCTPSATFEVPRKASIASDGREHKLTIAVVPLEMEFSHEVAPRASQWAFLKATATNASAFPLLASEQCSVFIDGNFVAKTSVANTNVGEQFSVYLGADKAVKVDYKKPAPAKDQDQSGVLTKTHLDRYHGEITLKNTKQREISVTVREQLPRSSSIGLKIATVEPDLGSTHYVAIQNGVTATLDAFDNVEWRMRLASQTEVVIPFEYTVEYPEGTTVNFADQ
eukprot:m51a1_g11371 hypothetical protein (546) ;mRNA; f:13818-16019